MSLKAIINLWLAYIDESFKTGIDNSLAIANYLDNPFLEAHCFRLAHLVSGYSALTGNLVSQAVEYFQLSEDDEGYVYSKNNLLLNKMGTTNIDTLAFSELAEFAINSTPFIDRLSTIVNNAGTACLVSGQYDKAYQFYDKAEKFSGQPIHHFGIIINKLTTRYMDGQKIPTEELLKTFRKLVRLNLPPQFSYHQSYLFWNIAKLSDFDKNITSEIYKHLKNKMFMNYNKVLEEQETMVNFLAKSKILDKTKAGRFTGPRGDFIHRTELFPVIHFQWM